MHFPQQSCGRERIITALYKGTESGINGDTGRASLRVSGQAAWIRNLLSLSQNALISVTARAVNVCRTGRPENEIKEHTGTNEGHAKERAGIGERISAVDNERVVRASGRLGSICQPPSARERFHLMGVVSETNLNSLRVRRPNSKFAHAACSLARRPTGNRLNRAPTSILPPSTMSPVS